MKGYKGFDKDLKCRGFQYEVGKTYECEGKIEFCSEWFPFLQRTEADLWLLRRLNRCRYCEIEASGEIIEGDGKCVCSKITIVREIPLQEFLALVNEGSRNTGWANEGNSNKGNWNKGRTRAQQGRLQQGRLEQGRTRATGTRARAT
jgi:hypothetical protein